MDACAEAGAPFALLEPMIIHEECFKGGVDVTDAFGQDCDKTNIDGRWTSIQHIMALATVLARPIYSVFPEFDKVPQIYRNVLNRVVEPDQRRQSGENQFSLPREPMHDPIVVLWSDSSNNGVPNHFVPLVEDTGNGSTQALSQVLSPSPDRDMPVSPPASCGSMSSLIPDQEEENSMEEYVPEVMEVTASPSDRFKMSAEDSQKRNKLLIEKSR